MMNTKEDISHPELLVQFEAGWSAGRCYSKQRYTVKRNGRGITKDFIKALDDLGAIGYGQELDWRLLPPETIKRGVYTINYSVAEVIRGCDSSD